MLQDISPHKYDIAYAPPYDPIPEDTLICCENGSLLLREEDGQIVFPLCGEAHNDLAKQYLFTIDRQRFFLCMSENIPTISGYQLYSAMNFRDSTPSEIGFAGITATQLHRWYTQHRFCGCCGGPMRHSSTERALICDNCNMVIYPRISPAVIIGVTNGDKLLLTHYANRTYKRHALVAGFCEVGEQVEDTVRREVMEEVGLKVDNIRYYKSQPWSFSDSLLFGFFCSVIGSDEIMLDGVELADADWHDRNNLPDTGSSISLTQEMIDVFREGKEPR